jgi:hypothetical protein
MFSILIDSIHWTQEGRTTIFATPAVRKTVIGIFVGHLG